LEFGLAVDPAVGLVVGLAVALAWVVQDVTTSETQVVNAEPPRQFVHGSPDAVITASRSTGLTSGLAWGLASGLTVGLTVALTYAQRLGASGGLIAGMVFGLVTALATALIMGLRIGLDAWLYHYCLRWRLHARGSLPLHLPAFLEWCACVEQGWLRIADAYEFRHRELLEHLTQPATPADLGVDSKSAAGQDC
jgi:hypothetical protein